MVFSKFYLILRLSSQLAARGWQENQTSTRDGCHDLSLLFWIMLGPESCFSRGFFMTEGYRNLIAWQKAKSLAIEIYRYTRTFPKDELYGLTSQMRRATISVASNIAEGKGRYSRKEFIHFLYQARGSLLELETQLTIAHELEYLASGAFKSLLQRAEELGRILNGLVKNLQAQANNAA
jgi:four helix bundle protein